jgi:hypothetical protein
MHRALKPGARFATAVWSSADKAPMCRIGRDEVARITGAAPLPNAPDPMKLADTSILESALGRAGFAGVSIERLIVTFEFASAESFADFRSQIGGARAMLARQTPALQRELRDAFVGAASAYAGAGGIVRLANETICFSARA